MCSFCARTIGNLIHVNSPGGSTSARSKLKHWFFYVRKFSDSVPVEIFTLGQPCTKNIPQSMMCYFFETRCSTHIHVLISHHPHHSHYQLLVWSMVTITRWLGGSESDTNHVSWFDIITDQVNLINSFRLSTTIWE